MGEIINSISLRQYASLTEDKRALYNELLKSVKSVEILRIGEGVKPITDDFWNLSWEQVETLRKDIANKDFANVINVIYNFEKEVILDVSITNIIGCYNWVIEKFKEILEAEASQFSGTQYTQQQINAGVKNFEQFEYYNQLDELTKGMIWKEDEVMKLPYWRVFRKICRNKVKQEYIESLTKQK